MDRFFALLTFLFILLASPAAPAHSSLDDRLWVKVHAPNKKTRDQIAALGVSIETVMSDAVIGVATPKEAKALAQKGWLLESRPLADQKILDFPPEDEAFRNYEELTRDLKIWAAAHPDFLALDSIGKSLEGREIWRLRISTDLAQADGKPGVVFMGGHHAREHISVETPLKLIERLIKGFAEGDPEIVRLVSSRDIHVIPAVNPDGKEYDVSTGNYRYWRKNRALSSGVVRGVDLNRNYAKAWGGGGSSGDSFSETYRGPAPFSEPETQAIKKFIEKQSNLTVLLSFHTFSKLILYPWGHTDDVIANEKDRRVYETLAETMAVWNGYTPQKSSELYIASGDTTDWAYAEHKIFSFTFELDPGSMFEGGFYPGADQIDGIAAKNWKPFLYLIDVSDNPYRVLEPRHARYGLRSALID